MSDPATISPTALGAAGFAPVAIRRPLAFAGRLGRCDRPRAQLVRVIEARV